MLHLHIWCLGARALPAPSMLPSVLRTGMCFHCRLTASQHGAMQEHGAPCAASTMDGSLLPQGTWNYSGLQQSIPQVVVGWGEPDLCLAAVLRAAIGPAPSMPCKHYHACVIASISPGLHTSVPLHIQKLPCDLRGLILAEDTKGQQDAEHPMCHAPHVLSRLSSH